MVDSKYNPVDDSFDQIDAFVRAEHDRHIKALFGQKTADMLCQVSSIMDVGPKIGFNHRQYGHNRVFIKKTFKTQEEIVCSYVHLLGDFYQEILRDIIYIVGEKFKSGDATPPFFENFGENGWQWDIDKKAIDTFVEQSAKAILTALESKRLPGEIHE